MTKYAAARVSRGLAAALAGTALLATAACSEDDEASVSTARASASKVAQSPTGSPTASPTSTRSPSPSPSALTEAQAETALIGASDLGAPWEQTEKEPDHDDLLKGTAQGEDCQKFLNRLNDDNILGDKTSVEADRSFHNSDNNADLEYEVATYEDQAQVEKQMAWLKKIPQTCDQFTAKVGPDKTDATVQVTEITLPGVDENHTGMRMTLKTKVDGEDATLTLDAVAVLMGPNGITFTHGGLDGAVGDTTEQAAKLGTERLKQVLEGKTPSELPSEQD
ncbi:hypothetical protein [Streptomyces sp. GC420]|uniref:hypothetical protein n=1 Tax=Streptomyces sp. GC420 TaxID=2697568 RepID=UPI001414E4C2|nr:hypothetical protein [Streptomyces sp. GC420]NBM19391.1 hypothetical protein [Streptomyces sp. GC420]